MKIAALLLLSWCAFGAAAAAQDPVKVKVSLRASATTRGTEILLADIADLQPPSERAVRIGRTVLGRAPNVGHARVLGRNEIVRALVIAGQPLEQLDLQGSDECAVQLSTVDLAAKDIVEATTAVLRSVMERGGENDYELECTGKVSFIKVPAGRDALDLAARVRGEIADRMHATVDLRVMVDGTEWQTIPVQFQIRRYAQVLKVSTPMKAGTPFGPHNVELSREPVQGASTHLRRSEDVEGMLCSRELRAGQLLMLGDVKAPALIRRGEYVTAVLTKGNMKIAVKAIANHDVALGDRVTVTNASSRAQLTGIATAPGVVVVPAGR